MKYVHGNDNKKHDLLMLWVHRAVFALALLIFLFVMGLFVPLLLHALSNKGHEEIYAFLLGLLFTAGMTLFFLMQALWLNARYMLDERGITVVSLFRTRLFPWDSFRACFTAPVFNGPRSRISHEYLILMISECGALIGKLFYTKCQLNEKHFFIVRLTDERRQEFEKYCTISECPDIPVYKY